MLIRCPCNIMIISFVIECGNVCFSDVTEDLFDKLDRLLNFCICYIFGLHKCDHVFKYRKQLKWPNIQSREILHILYFLYNILYNLSYLKTWFLFLSNHPLHSSVNNLLKIPQHIPTRCSDFFTVSAAR